MKILTVHGFGTVSTGFSEPLRKNVQEAHPDIVWDELVWSTSYTEQAQFVIENTFTPLHFFGLNLHTARMDVYKKMYDVDIVIAYSAGGMITLECLETYWASPTTGETCPSPLRALVTLGSPISLYAEVHGVKEPNVGRWKNIYMWNDPLGGPLEDIYEVVEDVQIRRSPTLLPHMAYWKSKSVAKHIIELIEG